MLNRVRGWAHGRAAANATAGKRRIDNLQFLRGFAASLVVVDHFLDRLVNYHVYGDGLRVTAWAFGEVGVEAFFAISGFVMAYVVKDSFRTNAQAFGFLLRRYWRIAPLYYLTSLAFVMFSLAKGDAHSQAAGELLLSFAFIPYVGSSGLIQPVYALGWTLNYEMFFYVLFAVSLRLGRRTGLMVLFMLIAGFSAAGLGAIGLGAAGPQGVGMRFYGNPILLFFAIGLLIGFVRNDWGVVLPTPLPNWALCLLAGTGLTLTGIFAPGLNLLSVTLAVGLCTMFSSNGRSPAFDRFSVAVGNLSYSLYLTHSFVLSLLAWMVVRATGGSQVLAASSLPLVILACFLAAVPVYRWIEWPLQRLSFQRRAVAA